VNILFFIIALIEGYSVMAFELISARILAPTFGSTLHVWGTVIGVTLLCLSIGYYIGGYITNSKPGENQLYIILIASGLLIGFLTLISQPFLLSFKNTGTPLSLVLISLALFSLPNILLGMIPTILINHVGKISHETGGSAGKIYSISTVGGILSCFANGFFIIPHFGLIKPAIFTGLLLGIIPFILLLKQKKPVAMIFLFHLVFISYANKKIQERSGFKLMYKSEGLLGQILVVDFPGYRQQGIMGSDRVLLVNRMGQTWVHKENMNSRWTYGNYIVSLSSVLPPDSKVLLLGLGGGTVAKLLKEQNHFQVDAVELDSRIIQISSTYFNRSEDIQTVVDDARHYIRTCKKKYDLILFDIFKGETPPSHVLTAECFQETQRLLNDGGMVLINFNGFITEKAEGLSFRSLLTTFQSSGFHVKIVPTFEESRQRNTLLIGTNYPYDKNKIKIPLETFYPRINFSSMFFPVEDIDLKDAVLLTDDNPLLEVLNIPAAQQWREDYTKNFTIPFRKKGIPLF